MATKKKKQRYLVVGNVSFKHLPPGKNLFVIGDAVDLTEEEAEAAVSRGLIILDDDDQKEADSAELFSQFDSDLLDETPEAE